MAVWSVGSRTVQATLPTVVSTITDVLKSAYANDCGSMRTHNLAFSPHEFAVRLRPCAHRRIRLTGKVAKDGLGLGGNVRASGEIEIRAEDINAPR